MKAQVVVDQAKNLIDVTLEGEVSVDKIIQASTQANNHPSFPKGTNLIIDITKALADWNYDHHCRLRGFAQSIQHLRGCCKWALIASPGTTSIEANLYTIIHEAHDIEMRLRVFSTRREALNWIEEGVD